LSWFNSNIWRKSPGIPFFIDPLKFEDDSIDLSKLFIKNTYLESIIDNIHQIINDINGFRRIYIIGERGMGKSTLLNYLFMDLLKRKYFPLYCDIIGGSSEGDTDYNFLYSIIDGFQKSIEYIPEKLGELKNVLNEDIYKIEKTAQLQSFLERIIKKASKYMKVIILIDEFDKKKPDIALRVLSNLQNFLNKKNVFYIFAGTPKWLDMLDFQDYSGINGKKFRLKSWDLDTTKKAIKRRLEIKLIFEDIIRDNALREIIKKADGIPRYILMRVNDILIEGGKRKKNEIDLKFIKEFGFWNLNSIEEFKKFLLNNKKERNLWQRLVKENIIIRDVSARESSLSILIAIFKHTSIIIDPDQVSREKLGINLNDYDFKNAIKKLKYLRIIEERNKKYTLLLLRHSFEYINDDLGENLIYLPYIIHEILPKKQRGTQIKASTDKTEILRSFFYDFTRWCDKEFILNEIQRKGEDITILKYNFEKYINPLIVEKFIFYVSNEKKYKKIPEYLKNTNIDILDLNDIKLIDLFSLVIFWIQKKKIDNILKNLIQIINVLLNKLSKSVNRIKQKNEIINNYEEIILKSSIDEYYKNSFITNIRELEKIFEFKEENFKKIELMLHTFLKIVNEINENGKKDIQKRKEKNIETEDQILKEVCKKIKKYRGKDIELSDFKLFLDQIKNFSNDREHYLKLRKCMVLILKRIKNYYFTFEDMSKLINDEIKRVLPPENTITYFGIFENSRNKSSAFWTYFINKINHNNINVYDVNKIIEELKSNPINNEICIIFIDDVIGTGKSFIKSYKKEFEQNVENIENYKKYVKLYLVTGIGSLESMDLISESTNLDKDRIRYSRIIRNKDKAFNENLWFDKEDLKLFKEFLEKLDPRHWDGWKLSGEKGIEYLVVMEWNTPNNTISCLWKNIPKKKWKAMFPRKYQRKKVN